MSSSGIGIGPGTGTGTGTGVGSGSAIAGGAVTDSGAEVVVDGFGWLVVGCVAVWGVVECVEVEGTLTRVGAAPSLLTSSRSRVGNGFWTCHFGPLGDSATCTDTRRSPA